MKALALITLALSMLVAPLLAVAQPVGKVFRIGLLSGFSRAWMASNHEAFQQGLRALGYVEGKNVILEYRYAEGNVALFPALAADLVRSNVDIIVATSHVMALAAKQATTTIPIVMTVPTDPVETGLV